jgi:hypothetical protein
LKFEKDGFLVANAVMDSGPHRPRDRRPAHTRAAVRERQSEAGDCPPPPPAALQQGEGGGARRRRGRLHGRAQGGGRGGRSSRTSRSGGHVAAAAGSPPPAPAAENGGAAPATPGGRRAGMLLRVCAGGEEGKDGAPAGLLPAFSDFLFFYAPSAASDSDRRCASYRVGSVQARGMVDKFRMRAKGGDGGNGCVSLRRSKSDRQGRPDGG